jgi:hypothetical protein
VGYTIDNMRSKRDNAGGKTQKGKNRRAEMVREDSRAPAASSSGAY